MSAPISHVRPAPDSVRVDIVDCVPPPGIDSALARETARRCLTDTPGCGLGALSCPAGARLPGAVVPNGAKAPGTSRALRVAPIAKTGEMGYPSALAAEFHAQTAAEAAPQLHAQLAAAGPRTRTRIGTPIAKTVCMKPLQLTKDYHDPAGRSIVHALTIEFADGSKLAEVAVGSRPAISDAVRTASRSWPGHSGPALPAVSRQSSNKRFSTCRWTRQSAKRCRSMSTSACM